MTNQQRAVEEILGVMEYPEQRVAMDTAGLYGLAETIEEEGDQ